MWAGAGALVVVFWALYMAAAFPTPLESLWAVAHLTCPITLARHHSLSLYLVLLVNTATYALIGLAVETLRRRLRPRLLPS